MAHRLSTPREVSDASEASPRRVAAKSQAWAERDRQWALRVYRAAAYTWLTRLLAGVSLLGNGPAWYAIVVQLVLSDGLEEQQCAVRMLLLGIVNLAFYYVLKRGIGRPRPYVNCADIKACVPALDQFSFPSGHALHAVSFSMLLSHYFPSLTITIPLWTFSALVMLSRVALGLHYPSDVMAAMIIGVVTGGLMLTTA